MHKTMTTTRIVISAMLLLGFVACKDKKKSVYSGCCGATETSDAFFITTKLYDAHGNLVDSTIKANVYIPNLFTNNNDGDNDIFMVFARADAVLEVVSFTCSGQDGAVLFHGEKFQPNDPAKGWNGLRPDGTTYQGSFDYEIKMAFVDGQVKTYTGQSCAYNCGEDGFPVDKLPDCFVPSQHDGNGGVDPNLPFPTSCFH